jgi:hypothetical protein
MNSQQHISGTSGIRCPVRHAPDNYFLDAHVHCCEFEDGAIILDMKAVSYLAIDAEYLPNLRACVENWPVSPKSGSAVKFTDSSRFKELLADLLARGILTAVVTPARSPNFNYPRTASAHPRWGAAIHRIPTSDLLLLSISLIQVIVRGRGRRLASLLAWIQRRQTAIHRNSESFKLQENLESLESFFRLRIWFYTAFRHCLFDSLVLSVFLTRRTVPCTFVIGVSTRPFAAHAWTQIGDCVLNDTIEHVLSFTPILAVGDCN